MIDKRKLVIDKAKTLAKAGKHFRFFALDGELWECYQSAYCPDNSGPAWFADRVDVYTINYSPDAPSAAQILGLEIWSGIK